MPTTKGLSSGSYLPWRYEPNALYVAQRLLEGEKYVTCSLVITMIEEIRESFKATLANFNTLQAPREVKVLETVIVDFNKRFRDGINVTKFREDPGRQPPGYTKVHQSKFNFGLNVIFFFYQPKDRTIFC